MNDESPKTKAAGALSLWARLRHRSVLRVALSYAAIGWLLLQIGDVVLDPLDAPAWLMRALIILIVAGFPVALLLAWYLELGPDGITIDHLPDGAPRPTVRGVRRYADAAVIAVLLGVIVVLLARQEGWLEPPAEPPVLAVLPFTDLGTTSQSYYADGLSDTLIHRLGQLNGLVVLASSSTFQFRGQDQDEARVARKLGADAILEGSLQRAGGVLRVNARLVDPATGQQLWTASFNRRTEELFEVQDEIATAISNALELVLSPREQQRLVHRDTLNLSAFDAYQRARKALRERTADSIASALQHLFDAIETDPEFALAHAALPEAYFLASNYRLDTVWKDVAPAARVAADRAVELDPELGEAYLAQAYVLSGERIPDQLPASEQPDPAIVALLQRAIELSPSNAIAWKLLAAHSANDEERLERLLQAAKLDPRHPNILVNVGQVYERMGQVDKARQWYTLALGLTRPLFWQAAVGLIEGYMLEPGGLPMAGRWARAIHLADPELSAEAWRDYCRVLTELGAASELERELAARAAMVPDESPLEHLYRLGRRVAVDRLRGDLSAATVHADRFERGFRAAWAPDGGAPNPRGPPAAILDSKPLLYLHQGRPEAALDYYAALYTDLSGERFGIEETFGFNARLLRAAALKQLGHNAEAGQDLRDYLAEMSAWPATGYEAPGLIPFAAHALLGDIDAALEALRKAIDSGQIRGWWGLRDGAFDPDFARVFGDPRIAAEFDRLQVQIAEQREELLREPELPLELRITAGLVTEN